MSHPNCSTGKLLKERLLSSQHSSLLPSPTRQPLVSWHRVTASFSNWLRHLERSVFFFIFVTSGDNGYQYILKLLKCVWLFTIYFNIFLSSSSSHFSFMVFHFYFAIFIFHYPFPVLVTTKRFHTVNYFYSQCLQYFPSRVKQKCSL